MCKSTSRDKFIVYSVTVMISSLATSASWAQQPVNYGYGQPVNQIPIAPVQRVNTNPNFAPYGRNFNGNNAPGAANLANQQRQNLNSRYRLLKARASQLISKGKTRQALPLLFEAQSIKPKQPSILFLIGLSYDQIGQPKKALPFYAKSLNAAKARGMDSCQLRINLGNTLIKLNHFKEAFYDYQRAIEIEPTNAIPHLYLGRAYLIKEDFNMALDEFRKCEDLGLNNIYLPFFKSLSFSGLRKFEDAKHELSPLLTAYSKKHHPELYRLAESLSQCLERQEGTKTKEG